LFSAATATIPTSRILRQNGGCARLESIPATDDPKIIAATTHRPCAER
jgi:hypothetical protein